MMAFSIVEKTMGILEYETITVVKLDGKIIGEILKSPEGFYYRVKKNKKFIGECFPTLAACKMSLV